MKKFIYDNKMMNRIPVLILLIVTRCLSYAQQLEVIEFHSDPTLIDAVRFPKNDLNGDRCGLVKIGLVMPDATFEGNVVHKEFKSGEWWIYLTKDSRWLSIKSKDYLPLRYEFPESIQSNVTYEMMVVRKGENDNQVKKHIEVSYYCKGEDEHKSLCARVEGVDYNIDLSDKGMMRGDVVYSSDENVKCLSIESQEDFDGNGANDALIMEDPLCGGSDYPSFYIVSYMDDGFFAVSNEINAFWNSWSVEDWRGVKTIVIQDTDFVEGKNYVITKKERYVLKNGYLEKVESLSKQNIVAVKELKSSDFWDEALGEHLKLEFDLDENGIIDYFDFMYEERWGVMWMNEFVLNRKQIDCFGQGIIRIGVLSSTTKGYHDLVFDENTIIKWDGKKYAFPDDN